MTHRRVEITLAKQFPSLVGQVYVLKKYVNMSTEEAWATILQSKGDPYTNMLQEQEMVSLATQRNKEWQMYQDFLTNEFN